jgi:hypothetical protein
MKNILPFLLESAGNPKSNLVQELIEAYQDTSTLQIFPRHAISLHIPSFQSGIFLIIQLIATCGITGGKIYFPGVGLIKMTRKNEKKYLFPQNFWDIFLTPRTRNHWGKSVKNKRFDISFLNDISGQVKIWGWKKKYPQYFTPGPEVENTRMDRKLRNVYYLDALITRFISEESKKNPSPGIIEVIEPYKWEGDLFSIFEAYKNQPYTLEKYLELYDISEYLYHPKLLEDILVLAGFIFAKKNYE